MDGYPKNQSGHQTLVTQHCFWGSLALLGGFICLFLWYVLHGYALHKNQITRILDGQSGRVERTFQDMLEYTQYQVQYLAAQLRQINTTYPYTQQKRLRAMVPLFQSFRPPSGSMLPWNGFSWIEDGKVILSSEFGLLPPPWIDTSHLDYYRHAIDSPETMHLSQKVMGKLSGKPVIACTYAVQSRAGKLLGVIILGIQLDSLLQRLSSSITDRNVRFTLYDDAHNVVVTTETLAISEHKSRLVAFRALQQLTHLPQPQADLFLQSSEKYYYALFPEWNYILITAYNSSVSQQRLYSLLLHRMVSAGPVCLLLLLAGWLFWKYFLSPMWQLIDRATRAVSPDFSPSHKSYYFFPQYHQQGIMLLVKQLEEAQQLKQQLQIAHKENHHEKYARTMAERAQQAAEAAYQVKAQTLGALAISLHQQTESLTHNLEFLAYNTHIHHIRTLDSITQKWAQIEQNLQFLTLARHNLGHMEAHMPSEPLVETTVSVKELVKYAVFLNQVQARIHLVKWRLSLPKVRLTLRADRTV